MNDLRWRLAGLKPKRRARMAQGGLSWRIGEFPWLLLGNKRAMITGGIVGMTALGTVAATAVVEPEQPVSVQTVVEQLAVSPEALPVPSLPFVYDDHIGAGDTIASVFRRLGIDDPDALAFLQDNPDAARAVQQLRSGSSLTAIVDVSGKLLSMRLPLSAEGESIDISRQAANKPFQVSSSGPAVLERGVEMRSGTIKSSLFAATEEAGVPDSVATQLADLFDNIIDFRADLRSGDMFSVIYEIAWDRGAASRPGEILAAEFVNQGVRHAVFRHMLANGRSEYFTSTGQSLRSAFLRSPLEFSRVTSSFGRRMHPVLRNWHTHSGVDFSAPIGTPVRVTADGVVTFVGRSGGYGKMVSVKHQDNISTVYAHLNDFANGLNAGDTVKQGETIGLSGATGRVTAPHLHYEFRVNDIAQNPMTAILPITESLSGKELVTFRENTRLLMAHLALLNHQVASSQSSNTVVGRDGKM
jgi:murein DD-endopeptidase MepM/ murein hydrolase activator NlpD